MPDLEVQNLSREIPKVSVTIGMQVIYKNQEWIVLNPCVRTEDNIDIVLIGAGPYNSIRDIVPITQIIIPQ